MLMAIAVLLPVLAVTGCTSVVKQNVISSINTGIGISLTENPQTQLYEAKLGYIRSQFYSVPTGKTVCDDCSKHGSTNCPAKNDADKAVTILTGIRVNSGIEHLFIGADIIESFAIGEAAVNSPVALAMYVAQAKNEKLAKAAASTATQDTFFEDDAGKCLENFWMPGSAINTNNQAVIRKWMDTNSLKNVPISLLVWGKKQTDARQKAVAGIPVTCP